MYTAPEVTGVTLHTEGVDRNCKIMVNKCRVSAVTLHTEGVDRNCDINLYTKAGDESPSTRRVWIEISIWRNDNRMSRSPSTRRVWIEMILCRAIYLRFFVTLHTEGVDRNHSECGTGDSHHRVTLHTEGVDRNHTALTADSLSSRSPSTRRVWIEI